MGERREVGLQSPCLRQGAQAPQAPLMWGGEGLGDTPIPPAGRSLHPYFHRRNIYLTWALPLRRVIRRPPATRAEVSMSHGR
jgi:hypothetical protein